MTDNNQQQIAVIGGGIIGVCTALTLQQAGYSVTLFDKDGVASACSKGNAGHFATEQVFPLANKHLITQLPKMLLDPLGPIRIRPSYLLKALPWFGQFLLNMRDKPYQHSATQLRLLNQHALVAYKAMLEPLQLEKLIIETGSILVFEQTPDSEIDKIVKDFKSAGVPVEKLSKSAVQKLEPTLSDDVHAGILFKTGGHSADPADLCQQLAKAFVKQGGQLCIEKISQIETTQPIVLKTNEQTHYFDQIVVATGAWSKSLAKQLGYKVPLDTERGYHVMVEQNQLLNRPVSSAERKFIMTPMSAGLRLAGTVEFAGLDAPENHQRAKILLKHGQALVKNLDTNKQGSVWMGHRPSLPDSLPVIGRAPNHPQVYFAFGHHHLGLTHGAITAQLICQQMSEQSTTLDLTPFCISRFN